jgi:hypothetical protein
LKTGVNYYGLGPDGRINNLLRVDVAESGSIDCHGLDQDNVWSYNPDAFSYVLDHEAVPLTEAEAKAAFAKIAPRKPWVA